MKDVFFLRGMKDVDTQSRKKTNDSGAWFAVMRSVMRCHMFDHAPLSRVWDVD